MSACTRYPDDEVVLRYVTSDLAEPEQTAFEDHLFACDACLARVERYQAAQLDLSSRDIPALPTVVTSSRPSSASTATGRLPWWALAAVAATLVAAVGAARTWYAPPSVPVDQVAIGAPARAPEPTPAIGEPSRTPAAVPTTTEPNSTALRLAVLAMVTPPPYLPITTRGREAAARFDRAMEAYAKQEWTSASRGLAGLDSAEATFYKGIADLMRGDAAAAEAAFEATQASGLQPYARESRFYLGKAALVRGDLAQARVRLADAQAQTAGPRGEAARLLTALDELVAPR